NPTATMDILNEIKDYMRKYNINDIQELIGCVK
ncbi:MAG: hypothetical protein K0S18_822, partial [Anaerocolumna sp.]|nr:hypothetical protein [Anaerocolumna sp.]